MPLVFKSLQSCFFQHVCQIFVFCHLYFVFYNLWFNKFRSHRSPVSIPDRRLNIKAEYIMLHLFLNLDYVNDVLIQNCLDWIINELVKFREHSQSTIKNITVLFIITYNRRVISENCMSGYFPEHDFTIIYLFIFLIKKVSQCTKLFIVSVFVFLYKPLIQ